jgi:spermidine synthase
LLALAFLLSGTCALAYQVVWARMLSLLFGSTNQAIATVLAVFMLGLALGSHFGEKVSRRGRDLGRAYGLMEMALGLFALCFPFLIARMGTAHALAFSLLHQNETLLSVARFGIAFALLIIPTALMGATLPVLAQHVEHDRSRVGSRIGALYAINTFGAALGAFTSAFIAIPFHGLHWTIYGAAFVNVLVGLACFVLLQDAPAAPEQPAPARTRSAKRPAHTPIEKAIPLWLVFCVLFTIGTVGMVLENAWSHALVLVFGTSVYAFATMLTSYLIGLSAGCFVASRFLLRFGAKGCLGALLLINGLAIFCTTPIIGYLPTFFVTVFGDMQAQWHVVMAKEFLACAALMFLPTFLGGATFPVCLNIIANSGPAATVSSARATSLAYIWNTAGSICGALVAGFALVPLFGSERSLLVASSLSILASVAILLHREATTTWRAGFAVAALAFSIASPTLLTTWDASIMNSGVYVYSKYFTTEQSLQREMRNYDILFYREGSASVAVLESQAGHRFLRVNGKTDGSSEGDNTTQMLLGYLPFLYAKDHANALVIGLGTGITSACALDLPITSVESIEISPEVVEAASYFTALNKSVFSDPRSTIRVLDGRTWLASMPKTYDLIVSEPSNPWQTGNANLFTADFFRIAASRLNEGGGALSVDSLLQHGWLAFPTDPQIAATDLSPRPFVDVGNRHLSLEFETAPGNQAGATANTF